MYLGLYGNDERRLFCKIEYDFGLGPVIVADAMVNRWIFEEMRTGRTHVTAEKLQLK